MASRASRTNTKRFVDDAESVKPTPMTTADDAVTEFFTVGFLESLGLPNKCIAGQVVADKKLKNNEPDVPNARHIQFKLGGVIFGFSCIEGDDPWEGQTQIEVEIISIEPNVAARRAQTKSGVSTQSEHALKLCFACLCCEHA